MKKKQEMPKGEVILVDKVDVDEYVQLLTQMGRIEQGIGAAMIQIDAGKAEHATMRQELLRCQERLKTKYKPENGMELNLDECRFTYPG